MEDDRSPDASPLEAGSGRQPGETRRGQGGLGVRFDLGLAFWAPLGSGTRGRFLKPPRTPVRLVGCRRGTHPSTGGLADQSPTNNDYHVPIPAISYPARPDTLVCQVPLSGRFEVSVDAIGSGAELGYGGMMMGLSEVGATTRVTFGRVITPAVPPGKIQPIGAIKSIPRPALPASADWTNRLTIRVDEGSVRFLANGHLLFEDRDPDLANPWLVLGALGEAEVDFRNLELTGQPTIPREVKLTRSDRLEGWLSDFHAESRPDRAIGSDGRVTKRSPLGIGARRADRLRKDWSAADGMIPRST